MTRIQRLNRSCFVSFAIVVGLLLLTVPASREFVAGNTMWLVTLTAASFVFCLLGVLFAAVADRVGRQLDQRA